MSETTDAVDIVVTPGAIVTVDGRCYCVTLVHKGKAITRNVDTGEEKILNVCDIDKSSVARRAPKHRDLAALSDNDWTEALECYEAIAPSLDPSARTTKKIRRAAKRCLVSNSTIYRWIADYEKTGLVTSFLRKQRKDVDSSKLDKRVEKILTEIIGDKHLTSQKLNLPQTHRDVESACKALGLRVPHASTLRRRIRAIAPSERALKRHGRNAALKHRGIRGSIPGAKFPGAMYQIDHTLVDLVIVDEVDRIPIGRPWITIMIDVDSRMVTGWYISFDPPGALATGICITNAILPKQQLLATLGVDYPWPCQGKPVLIHMDNAKEFRGNTLKIACNEHGIDLRFRKVKKPNYGAHIERLQGTLLREIHALPGTTFANPANRINYNSEEKAAMTLKEFELWLATLILGAYHHRPHKGLDKIPPIKHYNDAILGSDTAPGIGELPMVDDPEKLRIDFLPFEDRTIQPIGVQLDNIFYYADVLQRWVGARDPQHERHARKFIFRRDPRDISYLLFYDPDARRYFRIPYRDPKRPSMSLWELRATQRFLANEGKKNVDEDTIFKAYERMRRIVDTSKDLTLKARRDKERRRIHLATPPIMPASVADTETPNAPSKSRSGLKLVYDATKVKPFEEIEEV